MKFIQSKSSDANPVDLYYEDWGTGKPVVFIHGWPLDHQMWEYQTRVLAEKGLRCISYDRRGFGKSDKPWAGYDYDTFSDDLKSILDHLDLQDVTIIGFSMGGGEVIRYFSKHGGKRVSKVVLLSSIVPYTLKTDDNPDGVPIEVFNQIIQGIEKDRPDFLTGFGKLFYGVKDNRNPVTQAILDWHLSLALQASPKATIDCVHAFGETDFRSEIGSLNVPVLIIHGDADEIVPIKPTSEQVKERIPEAIFKIYQGAPHGLFITDRDRINEDLLEFIDAKE